jgi:hypothetical protein
MTVQSTFPVKVPTDGDGIPDESDPCPFDPTNAGATASDGDGIPDESYVLLIRLTLVCREALLLMMKEVEQSHAIQLCLVKLS